LKGDNDINYVLGAAVTYANANISTDSNNKSNVDSYQLALYNNNIGSNGLGLYNNNIINLAYNKYKNSRNINVGTFNAIANADYSGVQYGAKTGLGYNIKLSDKLMISPNASIRYSALDQQNYTETGAGNAGLIVRNDRFETLVSDLGVRAISKFDVNQHNVVPALNLSWSHNLMTDGQSSTSHYIAGGDPLANNSATLVKDIFNIGVEAGIFAKDKASSFTVRVDTQKGKEYIGYMGSLKYRYEF
jgi:uncharacterized protein with beta-barrel porin domain